MAKMNKQNTVINLARYEKRLPHIVMFIAFMVYVNTVSHGFALDDVAVITRNRFVQQGISGWPDILTTFYWSGFWDLNSGIYRPLSLMLFAAEWQFTPNTPFVHHFVNVFLYACTAFMLTRLLQTLLSAYSQWLPFVIALLFVLHPAHTEVVANIKSRDEILCLFFFVITARLLLRPVLSTPAKLFAALAFLGSLLSKEGGLLFLPVLALMLVQFNKDSWKAAAGKLWPLAAIAAAWLGWHEYVIRASPFERITYTYMDNSLVACDSVASRVATGIGILGRYILKSVWPYTLSYDYSFSEVPCETFASPIVIGTLLLSAGLLYIAIKSFRQQPVLSWGILFFFITISPTSNVFMLIGATMGDRFLYVPVLGTMTCIAWLLFAALRTLQDHGMRNKALLACIPVFLIYGGRTVQRNKDWKSDEVLFKADADAAPGSARVHYNYATALINAKKITEQGIDEAVRQLELAVRIDNNDANAWTNLGSAYYKKKQYAQSIAATRRALLLKPQDSSIVANLADAYSMNNEPDSAIRYHEWVISHGEANHNTYTFLGMAWYSKQQYEQAGNVFMTGLKADSMNADLWLNYGNTLAMRGRYDEAIGSFEHAYRLNPQMKNALYFIGLSYQNKGDAVKAQEYLELSKK